MKVIRIVLCFCVIFFVTTAFASAQNGAVITKDEGVIVLEVYWNGGDVISVHSSDSLFFCEDEIGDFIPMNWTQVILPNGYEMYRDHEKAFTRVYWPANLEDVFGPDPDNPEDPCEFIQNGPLVAEGITNTKFTDNNGDGRSPRKSVWQLTYNGDLYDLAGLCGNGIVSLTMLRKWSFDSKDFPGCIPNCVKVRVWKGPSLNCD